MSWYHSIIQVERNCGKFLVQLPPHLSSEGSQRGQVWFIFVNPGQLFLVLAFLLPSLHAWAMGSSVFLPCSLSCFQLWCTACFAGDQSWVSCLVKSLSCYICSFSWTPGWIVVLGGLCPKRPASFLQLLCSSAMPEILSTNSSNKANVICLNICPRDFQFLLLLSPFDSPGS